MHRNSLLLFERYAAPLIKPGDQILEIGPDDIPSAYQRSITTPVAAWDTLDFPVRAGLTHVLTEPYRFPVPENSYDVVLSGQVIVHVPKIWRWMPELTRVVRAGGAVVTLAPVSWPFCQAPCDYWRIYPDGLRALYEEAGLDVTIADWGSLELEPFVARLPARLRHRSLWQKLSGSILLLHEHAHLKVQGAFDTIVIGVKPFPAGNAVSPVSAPP